MWCKQRKSRKGPFQVMRPQTNASAFESVLLNGHHAFVLLKHETRLHSMAAMTGRCKARILMPPLDILSQLPPLDGICRGCLYWQELLFAQCGFVKGAEPRPEICRISRV